MGAFGGYYKGEKKKLKKKAADEKARKISFSKPLTFTPPQIIGREKK